MSILYSDMCSIPPVQAAAQPPPLHQSSSGTLRPPRWWRWLGRQDQRAALRGIADDPHLLRDLGLTREDALREAARPFWR